MEFCGYLVLLKGGRKGCGVEKKRLRYNFQSKDGVLSTSNVGGEEKNS